ncbi:MAG: hypothetical protein ACFBRM_02625 [Pikeienuella sp.]
MADWTTQMAQDGGGGPRRIGRLSLADGFGVVYTFSVYPARVEMPVHRAVFAYSRLEGIWPAPVFIGSVGEQPLPICRHPMRAEALRLGAIHLLVHKPDPDDRVDAAEAARRLVAWHRPVLNLAPPQSSPARTDQGRALPGESV